MHQLAEQPSWLNLQDKDVCGQASMVATFDAAQNLLCALMLHKCYYLQFATAVATSSSRLVVLCITSTGLVPICLSA